MLDRLKNEQSGTVANVKGAPIGFTSDRIESLLLLSAAPSRIDWINQRFRTRDAAIAFLKERCILVTLRDREAPIPSYRVTGKRYTHSLEELIELAETMGFEVPNGG